MTYEFNDIQSFSDNEHWTTMPEGQHPWEYGMRFVERDLDKAGWDGIPQLLLCQVTDGSQFTGMLTLTQVVLPEEAFRNNPLMFLTLFLEHLQNEDSVREFYAKNINDSRIVGIVLAFEGYGVAGTSEEVAAIRAEVGEGSLAGHPKSIEQRVLTGIPSNELKFYTLIRKRGEEPEFTETGDAVDVAKVLMGSRTHQVGLALMLEFQKMQTEAATA